MRGRPQLKGRDDLPVPGSDRRLSGVSASVVTQTIFRVGLGVRSLAGLPLEAESRRR